MFRHMISRHSGVALYRQVANDIRQKINDGEYPVDHELKPEKGIADEYAVGKDTVREALTVLKAEGLIETRRGYRARVRAPRQMEKVWLRKGEVVMARMPAPVEKSEFDIPDGVPVFVVGDKVYPADRTVLVSGDEPAAERGRTRG